MAEYTHDRFYIGGRWVAPEGDAVTEVVNPATEQVIGTVPMATAGDVARAVEAARAASGPWADTPPAERISWVRRIGEALHKHEQEINLRIVHDLGMPSDMSLLTQAAMPAETFVLTADEARDFPFEENTGSYAVLREPSGVAGIITPWNFPLAEIASKTGPALVAGCPVVVKPSEIAPLAAFAMAEVLAEIGLPDGVFNLVVGDGPTAGEALASHPGVDVVSFTGSTRAGRRVAELAAANVTRVRLELGGKSPNVLLPDTDLAAAVPDGVFKAFLNSGQTCSALTRMIVPRDRLAEVEELAVSAAESLPMGDPFEPGMMLGPLVSAERRDAVFGYIRTGIEEGARLVTGGLDAPAPGYYVRPTVFSDVTPEMTVAREEIFGPVLVIMPYDSVDDAVRIANDSEYGLAAAVWSGDRDQALAVARRLRVGQVEINEGGFEPMAPFGGYRRSGYGREGGKYGIAEFCELKAVLPA